MAALVSPVGLSLAIGAGAGGADASASPVAAYAAATPDAAPEPTVPTPPAPITVNEFLPDDQNLSDCLGALERPGCGSTARGGWRQTVVFGAVVLGLAVVFGRVAVGVRRNRAVDPPASD